MAMVKGQARIDPVTGLSGRIYTAMTGKAYAGLSPTPQGTPARDALAAICEAIAEAAIDEIQANALTNLGTGRIT